MFFERLGHAPVIPRDDWFDRLARSAARKARTGAKENHGSITRRNAVGLFAGTTAFAILGSWMKPAHALSAMPRAAPDPGCPGTRTFFREGCAKKVPKLAPYKPAVNGCGPQNGFNPVPQAPLYLADFSPACDGHDRGYGTCNRPKDVTDKKFLEDMKSICVGSGTAVTGLFDALLMLQCHRNAEIFYTAVSTIGDDPYKSGQSEGCDCCEECPGDAVKCKGTCCRPGFICSGNGFCCEPCKNGWIPCPQSSGEWARCGFGCCNPATPVCCPTRTPGRTTCCPGKCSGTGCG
jgi:hypothetical protein